MSGMFSIVGSLLTSIAAFVLIVVAVATPGWLTPPSGGAGEGVFISCFNTATAILVNCDNVFGNNVVGLVTAILCLCGAIFLLSGFVFFVMFINRDKKNQGYSAGVLWLFAAIVAIAAGITYLATNFGLTTAGGGGSVFGYSFYLCWVGAGLSIVAAIFAFWAGSSGEFP
ncbi:unnamed protein product [Clavelina lepadiformis]|uniref:Uncharacterized protein n=1 Tax=Clavelina lepadiformis TaxID=159417 RepID=A0ABP0EUQ3_CLALP